MNDGTQARVGMPSPGPTGASLSAIRSALEHVADVGLELSRLPLTLQLWGLPWQLGIFWGVDSLAASNGQVQWHRTLYDLVKQETGHTPQFWGRYIGRGSGDLSSEEAEFLHAKGCRILLCYGGTRNSSRSVLGGRAEGEGDAEEAISAARGLRVRPGVWIYANVDSGFHATAEWFMGWSIRMSDSQFGSGIYMGPNNSEGTNYCEALGRQFSRDRGLRASSLYIWSYQPDLEGIPLSPTAAPHFAPATVACGSKTTIWQYTIDRLKVNEKGMIDEDLATIEAYEGMW